MKFPCPDRFTTHPLSRLAVTTALVIALSLNADRAESFELYFSMNWGYDVSAGQDRNDIGDISPDLYRTVVRWIHQRNRSWRTERSCRALGKHSGSRPIRCWRCVFRMQG